MGLRPATTTSDLQATTSGGTARVAATVELALHNSTAPLDSGFLFGHPNVTMPSMGAELARAHNLSGLESEFGNNSSGHVFTSHDDATWILTSAFIVFTMQSGFGLLESGSVSSKNEVSIMVKNAVDVIFGGLSYWMFGFGLSFGEDQHLSNPFCGWGNFFVADTARNFGWTYSKFFFQASFATTATTIVSGAMAERTKLESYIIFSFLNTFVFCIPAHWFWARNGWLADLGVLDIAGAGPVHLVGGATGLVATLMLKPRLNRFNSKTAPSMGSPSNAILGMFMLWWGWLGFNCGSTFGISGFKWKLAARSAVSTICSSIAGGIVGLALSYITQRKRFHVPYLINGVLSALVSITGLCALAQPWEAFVIGTVGSILSLYSIVLLDKLKIDDPVGCVGVHAVGGIWSLISVGLFSERDFISISHVNSHTKHYGLFRSGNPYLLGIQLLGAVSVIGWTAITSFIILKVIDVVVGIRVSAEHELLGADLVEHNVGNGDCSYDKITNQITWLRQGPRAVHTCEECELVRTEVRQTTGDECRFVKEDQDCLKNTNHQQRRLTSEQLEDISDTINRNHLRSYRARKENEKHTMGKRFHSRRLFAMRASVKNKFVGYLGRSSMSYDIGAAGQDNKASHCTGQAEPIEQPAKEEGSESAEVVSPDNIS